MQPGTARAEGTERHAVDTLGPRPESLTTERRSDQARDLLKDLAIAAPARRTEARRWVALDSDRSTAIDRSLEM